MILVDTSVWIEHFRRNEPHLSELLEVQRVAAHQVVLGELATGNLKNRNQTLADLRTLPIATTADFDECLGFIELQHLHGRGLGWNDIQLLASAKLDRIPLWSFDKRLHTAAQSLGVAYAENA